MEEALTEIGLTRNEAKIYQTLLQNGPLCVRMLARESKLYRSCVYDALDQLLKKGLVAFMEKEKIRWFEALEPTSLLTWFKEKETLLASLIPKIQLEMSLQKESESKSKASMVEGIKAFRVIMFSWLEKKSLILVYGIPCAVPKIIRYFIESFHKERIRKRVWMKHIYNEEAKERIQYLNTLPYTEARYLPEKFSSPVSTMVCKDEIMLISWQPLTLIRIRNEALAKAYEKYFDILWEKAKKPKK
ncbi:MAG: helix-turn-helix domain-containing protein [Nanoarchaeota archaeon]